MLPGGVAGMIVSHNAHTLATGSKAGAVALGTIGSIFGPAGTVVGAKLGAIAGGGIAAYFAAKSTSTALRNFSGRKF